MKRIVREDIERFEHEHLSLDACFADQTKGRTRLEEPDPLRTAFQCDRDRILHSKSFRRLAHKTQVFLAPEGDHYRTRLIHTLEVAQVARSIARPLGLNEDLTEAIALGHDLGHTPFGHVGERALDAAMHAWRQSHGLEVGSADLECLFSHNEQSARIVELLEQDGRGLNLSFEVIDGIRCHSGNLRAQTLEGQVVGLADRIAYVTHDIDDAKRAGLLRERDLPPRHREVLGNSSSERIERMVRDIVAHSPEKHDIVMSTQMHTAMIGMRQFLFDHLYTTGDAKWEEPKAHTMIEELFFYFIVHLDEVPEEYKLHNQNEPDREVADFVAGMTDRYAVRMYEDLKIPHSWSQRSGVSRGSFPRQ